MYSYKNAFSNRCVAIVLGLSLLMSAFPASFFEFNFAFASTNSSIDVELMAEPASAPEYFEITYSDDSSGDVDLELAGWKVLDGAANTYTFGAVTLEDGDSYRVCQNAGDQTGCDASWGAAVWNNDGDTFILQDTLGQEILSFDFGNVSEDEVVTESFDFEVLSEGSDKITICHATASDANPFNKLSPNINSFFNGHDEDTEDVIPPFYYEDGAGFAFFAGNNWDTDGQEFHKNNCEDTPDDTDNDLCDPSLKPDGKNIATWHDENQFDGSDCFEFEVVEECGMFDVEIVENETPYSYSFRYVIGSTTPDIGNYEGDGALPVMFSEDEYGGSVEITYYIVGAEKDYFVGSDVPNIWDGNGTTVTVDTDCDSPEVDPCVATGMATLNGSPTLGNVVDTLTSFTIDGTVYNSGDSFDLFVAGDADASAGTVGDDVVLIERTADGFELFFYGNNTSAVREFSGSFTLTNVDASAATITAGSESLESTGSWPDSIAISTTTGEVTFSLFTNTANDSFVVSGLTKDCGDDEEEQEYEKLRFNSICRLPNDGGMKFYVKNYNPVSFEVTYEVDGTGETGTFTAAASGDGEDLDPTKNNKEYTFFTTSTVTEEGKVTITYNDGSEDISLVRRADDTECPTPVSTVTMCKYDTEDAALPNWQLALLGDEVDSVDFAVDGTPQMFSNVAAGDYVLKAEGAYEYRGNSGLLADARFSERKEGDAGYGTYPYQPWRITNPSTGGLAVSVNGDDGALWGDVFSEDHIYYGALTMAVAGDIDLSMYDDNYNDNVGTIDLALYKGVTGITGDNGCVTFDDVPYGTYEVAELMQPEWENVSGLGEVDVDEETELFEVVNLDPEYVEMCEFRIVSDDNTLVIPGNTYATSTYVHANWTTDIYGADWIWNSYYVTDPEVDETLTFVETFTVATATVGTLEIAADNGFIAYLNGEVVSDRSLPTYGNNFDNNTAKIGERAIDVTDELVIGDNVLEIIVTNEGREGYNSRRNPAGLLFGLTIKAEKDGEVCGVRTTEPEVITDPDPEDPQMFTISGFKWEDIDGDGEWDTEDGEEGIGGWTIYLDGNGTTTSTTTASDGSYSFMVPAGEYEVYEEQVEGWTQTYPEAESEVMFGSCYYNFMEKEQEPPLNFVAQVFVAEYSNPESCDFGNQEDEVIIDEEPDDEPRTTSYSSGTRTGGRATPRVLGASTDMICPFIIDHMQIGWENDAWEVTKLQVFLSIIMGYDNPVTGVFGTITDANVKNFQQLYASEVLTPWYEAGIVPHNDPTGFVYKTTKWKINDIMCPGMEAFPSLEGETLATNVDNDINDIND